MKTEIEQFENQSKVVSHFHKFKHFKELRKLSTLNLKYEEVSQTHPLHATVLALRMLGRIPLARNKSGVYTFKIYSWWTLYCLVSLSLQTAMVMTVVFDYFLQKERWSTFDTTVASLMSASILITISHAILFTWRKSHRIAEALTSWNHLQLEIFQDSFRAVTANQVSSWLLDHPYLGVLLPTLFFTFIEYLPLAIYYKFYSESREKLSAISLTAYLCAYYYVKLVLWLWVTFTYSIYQAAKTLKISLAETMARGPSVWRLRQHRFLWMELHNYARSMSAAIGNTVRAWLFSNVFSFYLSIYATALSFANNTDKISTMIPLMAGTVQAFLLNNASYLAEYQINQDFIVKILNFNYTQFTEDELQEVELFLYSIENSPERFSLEHMVKPSRETILDILQLGLMIMVILLQFRESS